MLAFTPIAQPGERYVLDTTLIPITAADDVSVTSLSDATQTLTFDQTLIAATVPGTWATWGSPPATESNAPRVLQTQGQLTVTVDLAAPATLFGVEMEPDSSSTHSMTASFYNGVTLVGSITQDVLGNAGAKLFAAYTDDSYFTSVVLSAVAGSNGFAIAQFRYEPYATGTLSATIVGNNLVIADTDATGKDNALTIIRSGDDVIIRDASEAFLEEVPPDGTLSPDAQTLTIPLSAFSGQILVNAAGGDDTLTVDLTGGNPLSSGITFNGGDGSDALAITGGSQENVTYNYTNANDGSVVMSAFGTIAYTGLEPLTNSGSATNIIFNLPAGGNPDVTLANHATAGQMQLTGSTFENTTFAVPSGSLTINGGSGADMIALASADAAFSANLFVNGGGNTDAVNVTGSFDAGAGNVTLGGLSDVETIGISGSLVTTGTVTLLASGNVSIAAGGINNSGGSGAVSVTSTGGTVQVGGSGIQSAGNVTVSASGLVTVQDDGIANTAGTGFVSVTSTGGGVSVTGNGVQSRGAITVQAAGNIGLAGGVVGGCLDNIWGSGAVSVTSTGGTVQVAENGIRSAGNVTVLASGQVTVEDGGIVNTWGTGFVSITSTGGGVSVTDNGVHSQGAITVQAAGNVSLGGGGLNNAWGSGALSVTSTGGTVQVGGSGIQSAGNVTVSASGQVTIQDGGIVNTAGTGFVSVTSTSGNVSVTGNGIQSLGTISVTADQNAAVSSLNTPGLVRVTAISGGITDAGGGMDITAGSVALRAAAGIGSIDALETAVTNLAAINTTSGDIRIDNTGALFITDVDSLSGVINQAAGGEIVVTASSPLTVNSPVLDSGGGDITLAAEGSAITDDLTINANVTASGGDGAIYLYAGDSISLAGAVTVSAAGAGVVLLSAGSDYNGGSPLDGTNSGNVTMASGSVVASEDGDIFVLAPNDVRLSFVNADSNNDNVRGSVTVIADYEGPDAGLSDDVGAILDNTPGETRNIRGGFTVLRAATGIGSGGGDADIDTNLISLDAVNSTSGDIAVTEVAQGGRLDIEQAIQNGLVGSIRLTTENGSLRLLAGGAGVQVNNASGTVLLDANVLNAAVDEPSRGDVVLNAAVTTDGGGITINADHDVLGTVAGTISSSGGNIAITADANNAGPVGDRGTIQLSGDITAGTGMVTFSLADCDGWLGAVPLATSGRIVSSWRLAKDGAGTLRLNGNLNTYTFRVDVNSGTLLVNGQLTANAGERMIVVHDGGTLGGNGTINTTFAALLVFVDSGGTLDPGDVAPLTCTSLPGQLTVSGDVDIQSGGTFRVQLQGLTPGVGGYDQLVLIGGANLNGDITSGADGGSLEVDVQFGVPVGAEFRIIDNDDTDLIDTRFLDLPEGAFLEPDGVLMNISYLSGSNNNDVTLTAPGRYDFDGVNGHTAANHMPISPFTEKTGANSAGWQTLPPRYFERTWPVLPPYTTEDERLKYDGHSTDREGNPLTFEVDVVPGKRYEVMILTGDVTWNHDRMRFDVYDPNGAAFPDPPVMPYSQTIDTWGAGAPDGSGVVVTWGGGDANTSGTGFYRWIRFTTDTIVDPGDGLGTLLMRMRDLGGWDPTTVILAMDIRPVEAVGEITIARTSPAEIAGGVPLTFTSLPADGMTIDAYEGTGAPPNATLTVTVTAGTTVQYAKASPDGDVTMFGTQVTADQYGDFTFSVLRPATLTNTSVDPEDWTILVEEVSGLSRGTVLQPYAAPEESAPLRFDFGISGSPVETNFLPVIPQTLYNATRGYGWTSRVAGANRRDTVNPDTSSALRTDLNYARNATFKVDLPNGTYSVRIYHSNPMYYGTNPYIADLFEVRAEGALQYTVDNIPAGTTWPLANSTFTITVGDGALDIQFTDIGGWDRNFVVSGIDISAGTLPGVAPLLAAGNPLDSGAASITTADLAPVVAEATAQWLATGLTPAQAATLQNARVTVADLGGAYLGLANPAANTIRIDNDAAMLGWSTVRGPSSVVNGGVDLLTVVMHEMGHLLGYDHSDDADDLMAPVLSVGTRYSPAVASRDSSWGADSFVLLQPAALSTSPSSPADAVFAELVQDGSEDAATELVELDTGDLLAARTAKSGEQAAQARVPRRSRMERYERELDAWFAELAAAEQGEEG